MKKYIFLFLLFYQFTLAQNDVKVSLNIDKSEMIVTDTLKVAFSINKVDVTFASPDFSEFKIISGPDKVIQTNHINAVKTESYTISYKLQPFTTGEFSLPEGVFIYENQSYKTDNYNVTIYENPIIKNNEFQDKLLFIPEISKTTPFVNEYITVNYKLLYDKDLKPSHFKLDFNDEYTTQYLIGTLPNDTDYDISSETLNNKNYQIICIQKDILHFADLKDTNITGNLELFFDKVVTESDVEIITKTQKLKIPIKFEQIKVKKLPISNISNSNYPVGQFDIKIEKSTGNVKLGETFQLKIIISGTGFLDENKKLLPELILPDNLIIATSETTYQRFINQEKLNTELTTVYEIKGLKVGKLIKT